MRIAITGHRDLDERTAASVGAEIRSLLARLVRDRPRHDLVGISCLAAGADQIFARTILDLDGRLEVVIPACGYEAVLPRTARQGFVELRDRAFLVRRLEHRRPRPAAYLAAGLQMLDSADRLIAVWDGLEARGRGGTAEIVGHARRRRKRVHVVWPEGAARTGSA